MENLNKSIKKLSSEIYRKSFETSESYYKFIDNEAKIEFSRIYYADNKFKTLNRISILTMFRLNLSHRFFALHTFGLFIDLPIPS